MQKPIIGQMYLHFSGKIINILGLAVDYKDSTKTHVIYRGLESSDVLCIPAEEFFKEHPVKKVPRYQLITPSKFEIK